MHVIYLLLILFVFPAAVFSQTGWQKHESPTTDTLHNAFFISAQRGWAISHHAGLILQTTDAGKTWKIQARLDEGYLESIYFINEKTGWLCGENGRVLKTNDGGKNWKQKGDFAASNAFSSVHFFDEDHGFIFGSDSKARKSLIFETRDGGTTWRDRSAEVADRVQFSDASFRFGGKSFIIGGNHFFRAEKGKKDFALSENPQKGTLRGLFFTNRKKGWAVGHRGLILKSEDGGKSWKSAAQFTGGILRSVSFIDEKHGFIVGNKDETGIAMWKTDDGGASWQSVKANFPNLHRLVSAPDKFWLFGAEGVIYSIPLKKI